jgi:hypothetical protein
MYQDSILVYLLENANNIFHFLPKNPINYDKNISHINFFLPEVSTGQGNPALPCILPCPEQGRVKKIVFYPARLRAG